MINENKINMANAHPLSVPYENENVKDIFRPFLNTDETIFHVDAFSKMKIEESNPPIIFGFGIVFLGVIFLLAILSQSPLFIIICIFSFILILQSFFDKMKEIPLGYYCLTQKRIFFCQDQKVTFYFFNKISTCANLGIFNEDIFNIRFRIFNYKKRNSEKQKTIEFQIHNGKKAYPFFKKQVFKKYTPILNSIQKLKTDFKLNYSDYLTNNRPEFCTLKGEINGTLYLLKLLDEDQLGNIEITVFCPNPLNLRLFIRSKEEENKRFYISRQKDMQTGNSLLDRSYLIQSNDPLFLQKRITKKLNDLLIKNCTGYLSQSISFGKIALDDLHNHTIPPKEIFSDDHVLDIHLIEKEDQLNMIKEEVELAPNQKTRLIFKAKTSAIFNEDLSQMKEQIETSFYTMLELTQSIKAYNKAT